MYLDNQICLQKIMTFRCFSGTIEPSNNGICAMSFALNNANIRQMLFLDSDNALADREKNSSKSHPLPVCPVHAPFLDQPMSNLSLKHGHCFHLIALLCTYKMNPLKYIQPSCRSFVSYPSKDLIHCLRIYFAAMLFWVTSFRP